MIYILAGLVLWTFAHGAKRFAPELRNSMGNAGKGLVAVAVIASVVLMVIGYRGAETTILWLAPPWLIAINNVLMLGAVYLFAVSAAKTRLARKIRHPMLGGLKVWAAAHILVNGDGISFVLFGGLIAWAFFAERQINADEAWVIPGEVPMVKEIRAAVISLVVFSVIVLVHAFAGPWPLFITHG